MLQEEIEDEHTCEKVQAESDTCIKIANRLGRMKSFKFNSVFDETQT